MSRTEWVRDTLIDSGLSVEHADRVMAEVKAEHAAEINRLRAELAKARTAALTEAASKVDNLLADTPEYGKFVAEFLRGMAAGGDL